MLMYFSYSTLLWQFFLFHSNIFPKKLTHYSPSQTITQHMRDYATKRKHPLQPVSAPYELCIINYAFLTALRFSLMKNTQMAPTARKIPARMSMLP